MPNDNQDWSALEDSETLDAAALEDEKLQQTELDNIDKMMFDLVKKNPTAMEYLFTKFVIDANIAVPGDDLLQIGINQGKANMIKWIYKRAELSQEK